MFKFFRKYQRVIILVGLPILLVLFLVPQAVDGIAQYMARTGRSSAEFVTARGETVTVSAGDYAQAQHQLAVLTRGIPGANLSIFFLSYDQQVDPLTGQATPIYVEVQNAGHWLLLTHEARALGLIGGVADAERLATNLGFAVANMSGSEDAVDARTVMANLAGNANVSMQTVIDTLANVRGVQRMLALFVEAGSGRISRKRLQMAAQDMLQGIDARTVVITADPEAEGIPEPTEEQLQAHLERYSEFNPGEGDRGFGYRLPDRVKLEWLEIDPENVREQLRHTEQASRLEVRKFWMQDKARFLPPGVTDIDAVAFADVEDQVREALLDDLATRAVENMVRFAEGEVIRTTRELVRENAYFVAPDDWHNKRLSLPELALEIQDQFESGLPSYTNRRDEWMSADEVDLLPGVGVARTSQFGAPMRLSDLIPLLKEFGGDPDQRVFVQAGFVLPTLQAGGRRFLVRIVDTQESHPADSVDDAREQLVEDLKRLAHYEMLVAQADEIEQKAANQGMEALADQFDTFAQTQRNIGYAPDGSLITQFQMNATQFMPPVGRHEQAINAVVERARSIITRMIEEGIAFDDLSMDERSFVVEVPDTLSLIAVQLTNLRPLTEDNMLIYSRVVSEIINDQEAAANAMDVFSEDRMFERYQYRALGTREESEDAAGDEAAAAAETDAATDE